MDIKLVLLDMDGTAVWYEEPLHHSTWGALGIAAGLQEKWNFLANFYYGKPELYPEWFDQNCGSLKDMLAEPPLEQILNPIPYVPGVLEFCDLCSQRGIIIGLISGGIDIVAERIKEEASLDFIVVNEVHIKDGKFTGTGKLNVPIDGKGELVKEQMEKYGFLPEQTAFIGNDYNDIPAWQEVGLRIGIDYGLEIGIDPMPKVCYDYIQGHFTNFHKAKKALERIL